jgi:dTDP-glucose 4,6-dehydratase
MTKILVTGGLGFIGSNFINYINTERSEWKITVLDLQTYASSKNNINVKKNKVIKGDIRNMRVVDKLVKLSDIVVNFAAETHNDNSLLDPSSFVSTNLIGTYNILESVRKYNKRLHHISTDEVFGDLPLGSKEKFNENSPYNPSSPFATSAASVTFDEGAHCKPQRSCRSYVSAEFLSVSDGATKLLASVNIFVASLLFGLAFIKTKNLAMSIGIHFMANWV